jgi:predicted transcriptional regulator
VRASDGLERMLAALEAPRTAAALARELRTDEAACGHALQQLATIGAIEWRDA